MTIYRSTTKTILFSALLLLSVAFSNKAVAQDGKALFNANCASCHKLDKDLTGPALMGVEERWGGSREKLIHWVKNSAAFLKTGDKHANELFNKWNKIPMPGYDGILSDADINAIFDYIAKGAAPAPTDNKAAEVKPVEKSNNNLLFGILTLILAIVAFVLINVNSNLKRLANEEQGLASSLPIPFWKNKTYITIIAVALFVTGGYLTTKGAIGLGRNTEYQPVQPIFYSHKVHAGVNQINCLYCHGGAEGGKHANIPSVNVCMNCHKAIHEYTGPALVDGNGKEVNGTEELQKLFKYAGFDPKNANNWNPNDAKPIEWVQIHSLPDHVYFNHSQHVVAGKVQCQTCHGEIDKMDEVKQVNDLSMGWCINCHRETKVQFKDNGFYSIYEKYHNELKSGKLDSTKGITVEKIGGTECQKCHY
ncbi:MAG TPA: c-type cytochrome [Chitinophagaceae bacterium]|nr:c-type cytochrome [Chitinophagaceae bacterium]MCC6634757.1 c-type cytochrome [Chitinophagaceae bacterium]HMZ45483.1 c-type cytochrome [Chitinophagaceae bacterium]HNF30404.1 c-type cytochrome [Chitinophagaceae bacterium]HNJ58325.1 c-type cytochrome [Chitinophagaceae bacterium]